MTAMFAMLLFGSLELTSALLRNFPSKGLSTKHYLGYRIYWAGNAALKLTAEVIEGSSTTQTLDKVPQRLQIFRVLGTVNRLFAVVD